MNLPKKLKAVEIKNPCNDCKSKPDCYGCIWAIHYNLTTESRDEQLEADQENYTQALEKIKELGSINESHRKLNGELRERIKELEAENAELTNKGENLCGAYGLLLLKEFDYQKRIKELEELIPTKEEAESIINALDENYSGDKEIIAKLQKIINKE